MSVSEKINFEAISNSSAMDALETHQLLRAIDHLGPDVSTSYFSERYGTTRIGLMSIIHDALKAWRPKDEVFMNNLSPTVILFRSNSYVVRLYTHHSSDAFNGDIESNFDVSIWTSFDFLPDLQNVIIGCRDSLKGVGLIPPVRWYYKSGNSVTSGPIRVEPPKPMFSEFYPWLDQGVQVYLDDYMSSDESVMILLGPPGTGKTSFIRKLIWEKGLGTLFTYDEEVLCSDDFMYGFMTDHHRDLLVVEDADLFLTSRESAGNKVMSKFLNVSDGLASHKRTKKIIFTANIVEVNKVDNALIRAGRCFDCQMFRRLTYNEACAAARVAGVPIPIAEREYTLAELFKKRGNKAQPHRMGFVA